MAFALNLEKFLRLPFVNRDTGTLTREGAMELSTVQRLLGGSEGVIFADTVAVTPVGGIAATDVQGALSELDFEKQTKDATLAALAGVSVAADQLLYATGPDAFTTAPLTAYARSLLDDADAATARDTLGLGNVDNTADADKPVSTATQDALDLKADTSALGTMAAQDSNAVSITAGTIVLTAGAIGYGTGNGGTVTQATSKSTGATLNELSGEVTMNNAALAASATVSFVLTNSTAAASDVVVRNHVSGGSIGAYGIEAVAGAGQITFYVRNNTAGSLSEAIVIRFAVIKAATS